MPKRSKIPPKKRAEILHIERPARFTEAEWAALTPRQKLIYSTNNGLFKPGETTSKRGARGPRGRNKGAGIVPLNGISYDLGKSEGGGEAPPPAEVGKAEPAFEVYKSDDLAEVVQVNGARLVEDAFRRAARAPQKVDPFDMHVYLALLQKMPQLRTDGPAKDESPADVRKNIKLLKRFLAEAPAEGEFREVKSG